MKKLVITSLLLAASAASWAKLPPPSDEAKAKAAEAAAKTAWTGKQDAYLLCKSQDRVAAYVKKTGGAKPAAKDVKDAKPVAKDSKDAKVVATAAPAAPAALPACADPGPFVYTPPEAVKPLEAAGAHSPAATAKSPPSTNTPAAAVPSKKI